MSVLLTAINPQPGGLTKATPNATTSTAEISIGTSSKFMICAMSAAFASVSFNIKFGVTGMSAATVADIGFPPGGPYILETPNNAGFIRVFNPTAAAADIYVTKLMNN